MQADAEMRAARAAAQARVGGFVGTRHARIFTIRAGRARGCDNGAMQTDATIADSLRQRAREAPERVAMRCPGRGTYDIALTYGELDARSDAIAAGLAVRDITRGQRVVVMVRPTPEFFLLMFALFKLGAVPVLVDPGIDKRALKQCLDEASPHAFIGIPLAMLAKTLLGWAKSARLRITTGRRAWCADTTLADIEAELTALAAAAGHRLQCLQSNAEHVLVERIQAAMSDNTAFIIINPAAFTHTSVAMRDALAAAAKPFIEVHISNIHAREPFRRHSHLSDLAMGVVCGLGTYGYEAALQRAIQHLQTAA